MILGFFFKLFCKLKDNMNNSTILIIGGTGSLGHKLVDRYVQDNIIYVYSRDECKPVSYTHLTLPTTPYV